MYINGRAPQIRVKFLKVNDYDIALNAITHAEMRYGAAKSQTPEVSRAKQEHFFNRFVCLPFDDAAAIAYGGIRATLERKGTPISSYDMLIASIAIAHDLILVTHNVREFERIEGLKIEDWER